MTTYQNYHNTGATHDIEYVNKGDAWYFRLRWNTKEFKPLNLQGDFDGDGHFWGHVKDRGENTAKLRLRPVEDEDRWPDAEYIDPAKPRVRVPATSLVSPGEDSGKLPSPSTPPTTPEKTVLTLSDLRTLQPSADLPASPVSGVQDSHPVGRS